MKTNSKRTQPNIVVFVPGYPPKNRILPPVWEPLS